MEDLKLIGYSCSYVPVEILGATGFQPYRLLNGTVDRSRAGDGLVRVDACPLVKSNLSYVLENEARFAALVGASGCDMARRMFDVIGRATRIPLFLINNPRTDNPQIYSDEIDWLTRELEHLAGRKFDESLVQAQVKRWEAARDRLRGFDTQRRETPSRVSTTEFHRLARFYHAGMIDELPEKAVPDPSGKPRVFLLGSPLAYESEGLLGLLEGSLRIVGDHNCGLSRMLDIRVATPDLDGIKKAYYGQSPCVLKRPNHPFYDHVTGRVRALACAGAVAYTLDYCDNYEFELKKIERLIGVPLLRIRSDFSLQGASQLRMRIEAFAEMIGTDHARKT